MENKNRKSKTSSHKSRKHDLISSSRSFFVQVLTIRKGAVNDCSNRYAFRNSNRIKVQNSYQGKMVNVLSLLASWTKERYKWKNIYAAKRPRYV